MNNVNRPEGQAVQSATNAPIPGSNAGTEARTLGAAAQKQAFSGVEKKNAPNASSKDNIQKGAANLAKAFAAMVVYPLGAAAIATVCLGRVVTNKLSEMISKPKTEETKGSTPAKSTGGPAAAASAKPATEPTVIPFKGELPKTAKEVEELSKGMSKAEEKGLAQAIAEKLPNAELNSLIKDLAEHEYQSITPGTLPFRLDSFRSNIISACIKQEIGDSFAASMNKNCPSLDKGGEYKSQVGTVLVAVNQSIQSTMTPRLKGVLSAMDEVCKKHEPNDERAISVFMLRGIGPILRLNPSISQNLGNQIPTTILQIANNVETLKGVDDPGNTFKTDEFGKLVENFRAALS